MVNILQQLTFAVYGVQSFSLRRLSGMRRNDELFENHHFSDFRTAFYANCLVGNALSARAYLFYYLVSSLADYVTCIERFRSHTFFCK